MNGHYRLTTVAGLMLLVSWSTGCATLHFPWEKPVPHSSARNPVVQIVCLWEPAEGKDPDGKSCRGFAGQLIFLGNKGGAPVVVDGMVRVKQYDQQSGFADESEPFHQFEFDKKVWNMHMHVGTLGPTYNVFIPYMRKGNHDVQCELQLDYIPDKGGHTVSSTVTSIVLQGKHSAKATAAAREAASIIPHTPMPLASDRGARTTTISLDGRGTTTDTQTTNDPVAARLERMERIMQDFASQQTTKSTRPVEPTPAAEPVAAGNRFSLNERRTANANIVQTAAAQIAADNAETQASTHPLNQRRHLLSAHPLAAEDNPAAMNREANVAQSPVRRHPLSDEPAFAKSGVPQFRNTPPATLVVPEELSDAPTWTREENATGHATLGDELDGKTSQVP